MRTRPLLPLPDQEPAALIVVQSEQLDGSGLSPLAIRRFNRAEIFAFAADDDDAPASQIGGGGLLFGTLHRRYRRDAALVFARVGSLGRVMQPTGRRTAGCLSIRVEPRAARLEISPLPVTSRIGRPATILLPR